MISSQSSIHLFLGSPTTGHIEENPEIKVSKASGEVVHNTFGFYSLRISTRKDDPKGAIFWRKVAEAAEIMARFHEMEQKGTDD